MTSFAIEIQGADRAAVFTKNGGLVIAVADGDGAAPQAILDAARDDHARDWTQLLLNVDDAAHANDTGETTAVVIAFEGDMVAGASVGDSGAWWIDGFGIEDLTAKQHAKPLLGTSNSSPFLFRMRGLENGTLLVATAGLLAHANRDEIAKLARGDDLNAAARALVALAGVRDVALVLAR